MPPIRQMAMVALILFITAFGMILMIGSFETSNNLPLNATIAQNYQSINANPSSPAAGVFVNFSFVRANANTTAYSLQHYSSNPISSLINTVQVAASLIFIIPNIFGLMGVFIAAPLSLFMPVGFAQIIASVALVLIFAFGILSGVLLFPI